MGSAHYIKYKCSVCGAEFPNKESLTAKQVRFMGIGRGAKSFGARIVAWLCSACLAKDDAYNQPATSGSPGVKNVKMQNSQYDFRQLSEDLQVEAEAAG